MPLGRTSTGAGKAKTVESVAADLGDAMLAFTVDGAGMEIKVLDDLRDKLPETSKARMVKNTLMKRAGAASGWDAALVDQVDESLLTKSNLWIFAPEDNLKETQGIKGGLFEGEVLDAKKVAAIKDLPTLPELMTRLAVGINMAGAQGIAKSINLAKGGPHGIAIRLKKVVDEEKL